MFCKQSHDCGLLHMASPRCLAPAPGGVAAPKNRLVEPLFSSVITNSLPNDAAPPCLYGSANTVVAGHRLAGTQGNTILVLRARSTVIVGKTLTRLAGSQALRITAGSGQITGDGNVLTGATRIDRCGTIHVADISWWTVSKAGGTGATFSPDTDASVSCDHSGNG